VNGRLVPLESELASGDSVEVLVSKSETAGPSRDWLKFVHSAKARSKIRQYFVREQREEHIETGKDRLTNQLRRAGLPVQRVLTAEFITELADHFKVADANALYAAIGEGHVSAQAVVNRLVALEGGSEEIADAATEDIPVLVGRHGLPKSSDAGVVVEGDAAVLVKLARCCMPVPGDEIIGFVTRGSGVSVHRTDCPNAEDLRSRPERIVQVSWSPTADSSFLVALFVEGLNRAGIIADVSKILSDQRISIISANISTSRDRVFRFRLTFETTSQKHLEHVIGQIKRIPGVYETYRLKQ
jgi:GTP pyrophosphokinase